MQAILLQGGPVTLGIDVRVGETSAIVKDSPDGFPELHPFNGGTVLSINHL